MKRKRRGVSLIEMVMAMTVGFILLGLGARMLVLLLRLDRAERSRLAEDTTLDRLSRQLRRDIARSNPAKPPDANEAANGRLVLDGADGSTIRYEPRGESLARAESKKGDEVVRREDYRLSGRETPRFEIETGSGPPLIRLRWVRKAEKGRGTPSPDVPIEAILGRDRPRTDTKEGAR